MSLEPKDRVGADQRLPIRPDGPSLTPPSGGLRPLVSRFPPHDRRKHPCRFVIIQIVCIAAALIAPTSFRYLSGPNISVMLQAIPSLGIVALGVGVLMIAGEFDLSVGTAATFVSVVAAMLMNDMSISVWIASPIAIVLGTLIRDVERVDHAAIRDAVLHRHAGRPAILAWDDVSCARRAVDRASRPDPVFQFVFGGSLGLVGTSFLWLISAARVRYDPAAPPWEIKSSRWAAIATWRPQSASRHARSNS